MKRAAAAAAVGALLSGLVVTWGPVAAQEETEGVTPISIYSLDDGNVDDSVADPANTTPSGTIEGGATPTEDRFGDPSGALACGPDAYVQTQEPSNINPLTFSAWFRADDVSDEHSIVDSDASGQYGHSLIIGYDDPNDDTDTPRDGSLSIQYHDGVWDTDVVIDEGEWTNVFVTYSGDKIRVYIGTEDRPTELVAERDYTPPPDLDGTDFRFCRHNPDDPQAFIGAIDDIRFYDGAVDPTDPDFPVDPPADETTTVPGEPETTEPEEPICPPTDEIPPMLWGDVHVRTLDALVYDFQFTGDFVAAQTGSGEPLMQARMKKWDNPRKEGLFSVNSEVAMDVAGDEVVVIADPAPAMLVNGEPAEIPVDEPLTLTNGGVITPADPHTGFSHDLAVEWPDGETGARLQVSERPFIDVGLCSEQPTDGLVGDPNGDPGDDMTPRDDDPIEQPADLEDLQEFGDSWRVPDEESLFAEPLPAEESETPDELVTLEDLPEDALAEAEQACAAQGITDPVALHTCTYDVAATGDPTFVDSAEAQETAIEALPESTPEPVVAVEGTEIDGVPLATTSDPDTDTDDGVSPLLLVGLGVLVLALIGLVVALVRRGGSSGPSDPSGPAGPAGYQGPSHAA